MKYLKIASVVVGLLLIGFVSGFYTHRYVTTRKIEKVAELRMARGFQERFFEKVQATEAQKEVLQPIVEKFGQSMAAYHQNFREGRRALTDSLFAELKPHLNEKQIQQLQEFNQPYRGRVPGEKGKNSPRGEKVRQ